MSTEPESCVSCGATSRVEPITGGGSPKVRGWSCGDCGTQWWISVVNPRPYLDRLTAVVELGAARWVLRQLTALADTADSLSDTELRERLTALASLTSHARRRDGTPPCG